MFIIFISTTLAIMFADSIDKDKLQKFLDNDL